MHASCVAAPLLTLRPALPWLPPGCDRSGNRAPPAPAGGYGGYGGGYGGYDRAGYGQGGYGGYDQQGYG